MMNFIVLTLSLTIAMVLASVIVTVAMFALACNTKFVAWFGKLYIKLLEKSLKNINEAFEDVDA